MTTAEALREQAITELRLAILALDCGEMQSAVNHSHCAIAWIAEIQ